MQTAPAVWQAIRRAAKRAALKATSSETAENLFRGKIGGEFSVKKIK